jgi:drug/metabolite transporter (DMT)-like permease
LASIATRSLTQTDSTNAILLYSTLVVAAVGAMTCLFGWKVPTTMDLAIFVFMGFAGAIGNYLMTRAFYFAQVKSLAPFDYTALVWATVMGYALWHDLPTAWVCVGAATIVIAGIYTTRHERSTDGNESGAAIRRLGG